MDSIRVGNYLGRERKSIMIVRELERLGFENARVRILIFPSSFELNEDPYL